MDLDRHPAPRANKPDEYEPNELDTEEGKPIHVVYRSIEKRRVKERFLELGRFYE